MKTPVHILLRLLLFANLIEGCQKGSEVYYYPSKVIAAKYIRSFNSDTLSIIRYYENGNIMDHAYITPKKTNGSIQGIFREFFPDGYPKTKCEMLDGVNVLPLKKEGEKYKISIDFGRVQTLPNGKVSIPFRTFIEGVSPDEYIVSFINHGKIQPKRLLPKISKYKIVFGEQLKDTSEVEIDESMYSYVIDDLQGLKSIESNGDTCIVINFDYYNYNIPNDTFIVKIQDVLSKKSRSLE